jgi:predicted transposase YbfD/YdcC
MILMALCAVLCGADNWVDVAEWAEDNESWLRRYLVLEYGTPSHDTFSRVFRILDAKMFEQCFRNWIAGLAGVIDGVIALDGKTICGSRDGENTALHMVSAYATASGLCLGGDYLLAVKDNQGKLADALREFFAEADVGGFGALPVSRCETVEKDHGRIETRSALWVSDLDWLDRPIRQHWPKLAGVGMLERTREVNGKTSTERAFYIGSKGIADAQTFANAARSHWGIENSLHWVLDVTFREDDCRVRKGHAPQNLSALRKLALSLLRQDTQYPKRSLRSRRKTADRIPDYRASLLGLAPLG